MMYTNAEALNGPDFGVRLVAAEDDKRCSDGSENSLVNTNDPASKQNNPGLSPTFSSSKKRTVPHEVDFDINPTALYRALYKRQWEAAMILLRDNPKEARTWISRKQSDGKLRWRLLPIHCAIIYKSPEKLIQALVHAYPGSVTAKDDLGMVPHQLAHHVESSKKIISFLVKEFKDNTITKETTPPVGSPKTDALCVKPAYERNNLCHGIARSIFKQGSGAVALLMQCQGTNLLEACSADPLE